MRKTWILVLALISAIFVSVAGAATAKYASSRTAKHVTIANLGSPGGTGVGFGSVWVLDHRGGTLWRIDPKTNRAHAIQISESLCSVPVFGAGAVWIWGCDSNVTYEVSPRTNHVVAKRSGGAPAFGAGSLWTLNPTAKILRIDPHSGVVLATIDPQVQAANGGPGFVADGSLWVAGDDGVSRIDVSTNKVSAVIPLAGSKPSGDLNGGYLYANYLAYAAGKIWDSNAAGMYEIDPATNTAKKHDIRLHPLSQYGDVVLATDGRSLWFRTSDTSIERIDASSGLVVGRYPAPHAGGGGSISVAFGSLWIANFGAGTVWREPLH